MYIQFSKKSNNLFYTIYYFQGLYCLVKVRRLPNLEHMHKKTFVRQCLITTLSVFHLPGLAQSFPVTSGFTVQPDNRQESRAFFLSVYAASDETPLVWSGSFGAGCYPGDINQVYRDATLLRINYFRAMAGVPAWVQFDAAKNRMAQDAAYLQSVNSDRAPVHEPIPASWACDSQSAVDGSKDSNLAPNFNGPNAVDVFMKDPGAGNNQLGHRRWLLYPQVQNMGSGDVPAGGGNDAYAAIFVVDSEHTGNPLPELRETGFFAWPPPGYVPYPVVYPRWSITIPGANFATAQVTVTKSGAPVSITVDHRAENGPGEPTMVWRTEVTDTWADWNNPGADTSYHVQISNILIDGSYQTVNYDVIIFDPSVPGPGEMQPVANGNNLIPSSSSSPFSFEAYAPEASIVTGCCKPKPSI